MGTFLKSFDRPENPLSSDAIFVPEPLSDTLLRRHDDNNATRGDAAPLVGPTALGLKRLLREKGRLMPERALSHFPPPVDMNAGSKSPS